MKNTAWIVRLSASPASAVVIERTNPVVDGVFVSEDERKIIVARMDAPQGTFFDYASLHVVAAATLDGSRPWLP